MSATPDPTLTRPARARHGLEGIGRLLRAAQPEPSSSRQAVLGVPRAEYAHRMDTRHEDLARAIAGELIQLPMVEAVCLGGSRGGTGSMADASSDIDLEVYTRGDVPLDARAAILEATGGATRCDLGLPYWGPGDAWLAAGSDIEVDLVFFDAAWMEDQVARVLVRHEPALGYSTCFWHTVRNSLPLEDPRGWFAALQARARVAYPEALRSNIVAFNRPALRGVIPRTPPRSRGRRSAATW